MKTTNSTYADRLNLAMTHAGMHNLTEIASRIGVSPQSMQFLASKGKSSTHTAALADLLGVSALWLEKGWGDMLARTVLLEATVSSTTGQPHSDMVPLISLADATRLAGTVITEASRWLRCPSGHSSKAFALSVEGHSMISPYPNERSYPPGSLIFVDPEKPVTNGSRIVASIPGQAEATFKKYVDDAGQQMLMPLNPAYKTIDFTPDMNICGVVIGSYLEE